LAAIDSISFVTPKTVYKSDVTRLDETLLDYIIGSDSLTLKLKASTPASILPHMGEKLVLLDGCEALPYGFSGIVSEVRTLSDGIDVVCEQAYLEDLFDSYCSVSTTYGVAGSDTRYVASNGRPNLAIHNSDNTFRIPPFSFDITDEISQGIIPNGDLALKGGVSMSVSFQPTFRVHTFLMIGEEYGTYFSCAIKGDIDIETSASLYGGIEFSHDFGYPVVEIPIPYTGKLFNFYIMPGVFGRMSATIASTLSVSRKYILGMAYDYSSKNENVLKSSLRCRQTSSSIDFIGSIDGSLAAGVLMEMGINVESRDFAKVCVRGEYGGQLNGSYVFRNSDIAAAQEETKLYERLKASSIETGPFANLSLQASVKNSGRSLSIGGSATLAKKDIVPTFSNTKLTRGSNASVNAHTEMSGNCAFPVIVGYKLFDEQRNVVADYDAPVEYTNMAGDLEHRFMEVSRGNGYTVYPKVKLFGYDILASPPAELAYAHPKIVDFKVTDSEYSQDKFTNDGMRYNYRYDVAVTAEIDNLDGVADWGYVYKDPNGKIKRISLMKFGTSYTDTRYAYYRNEAKPTACLYTYVKYEGDSEYMDDEPQYYQLVFVVHTCPDNHHPHAIDLGLPSGTKWCCCNVGASAPEEYGGYYAWGEISEKSVYNEDSYAYFNSSPREWGNIGSEISGTQYDVARVRMGAPWRMPTYEQQMELVQNCTRQWTQQNGGGVLVTGPNGNQVYLPAGGHRLNNNPATTWHNGYYWSGTLDASYLCSSAYHLCFGYPNIWNCYYNFRSQGYSVRAVCP